MRHSESIAQLAAALAKAQARIQPAVKDKVNPAFRSHYATLEAIVEACREALAANDLAVLQLPCDDPNCERVALRTMIVHKSGEFIEEAVSARLVKNDPQGLGSALTYLRRYALAAIVGVTATEDDDGNAASAPQQVQRVQPSAPPPTAAPRITPTIVGETQVFIGTLAYVKSDQGTSKAGKQYTKTRVGWTDDSGEKVYATTFSETDGAFANRAKTQSIPVRVTYRTGERGVDVISIDTAEQVSAVEAMGGEDVIPF